MKLKQWENIFHVDVNTKSIVRYVIESKSGLIKHVNENIRIVKSVKRILVGILAEVFAKIISI